MFVIQHVDSFTQTFPWYSELLDFSFLLLISAKNESWNKACLKKYRNIKRDKCNEHLITTAIIIMSSSALVQLDII